MKIRWSRFMIPASGSASGWEEGSEVWVEEGSSPDGGEPVPTQAAARKILIRTATRRGRARMAGDDTGWGVAVGPPGLSRGRLTASGPGSTGGRGALGGR